MKTKQGSSMFVKSSIVLMVTICVIHAISFMMIPNAEIDFWYFLNVCPLTDNGVDVDADNEAAFDTNVNVPLDEPEMVNTFVGVRLPQLSRCPDPFLRRDGSAQVFEVSSELFRKGVAYKPVVFRNNEATVDVAFSVYLGDKLLFAVDDLSMDPLDPNDLTPGIADLEEGEILVNEEDESYDPLNPRKILKGGYSRSRTSLYRTRWGHGSVYSEKTPIRRKYGYSSYEAVERGTIVQAVHVGPPFHDATNCIDGCNHGLVHYMVRDELTSNEFTLYGNSQNLRLVVDKVEVKQNRTYVEIEPGFFTSSTKRGLIPKPEVFITFATSTDDTTSWLFDNLFFLELFVLVVGIVGYLIETFLLKNYKRLHRDYVIRQVRRMPFPAYRQIPGETVSNMSGRSFTSTEYFSPEPETTYLNLSSNDIRSFGGLNKFPNLERLNLYNNDITDFERFGSHNNLLWLDVSNNDVTKLNFPFQPKLEWLNVSKNDITTLGELTSKAPNLMYLNCSDNDIEMLHVQYSSKQPSKLRWIDASNNDIMDLIFDNCQTLTHIDLSSNSLEECGNLWECTSLEYINLANNRIIDIDETIFNLINLPNLTLLDLSRNPLPEEAKTELKEFFRMNDKNPNIILF
eukprot:TRINITY_DN9540_c0_g1_i1.p1 TRINITY_DN9540_c0_g1~~TRINITY_DN9540_c0_g1_i1.p1  ORF type:complete len:627 (-),score=117.35 TRINITY_DN9540_c0_g1_i1:6-1886(-)